MTAPRRKPESVGLRRKKCLDAIERRLSEGQGSQPWSSCQTDLEIVRVEREQWGVERVPKNRRGSR